MAKSTPTRAPTRGKPGPLHSQAMGTMASAKVVTRKRRVEKQTASVKIVSEPRQQLIAQTAYFIAERRGFAPGNELEDWLQAEAEIEACMKAALK